MSRDPSLCRDPLAPIVVPTRVKALEDAAWEAVIGNDPHLALAVLQVQLAGESDFSHAASCVLDLAGELADNIAAEVRSLARGEKDVDTCSAHHTGLRLLQVTGILAGLCAEVVRLARAADSQLGPENAEASR